MLCDVNLLGTSMFLGKYDELVLDDAPVIWLVPSIPVQVGSLGRTLLINV